MLAIGLTGGIGCGKSAVADIFARLGASIIDTDQIARQLTEAGQPALLAIGEQFGTDYFLPDGSLDRPRLRRLVFANTNAKKKLEHILHPLIKEEVLKRLAGIQSSYVVIVVPLLLETGNYGDLTQRVLVVDCSEAQQVERVMARSNLTEEEVRAIMAAQIDRTERLRRADDLCNNHGDQSALQNQVLLLHQKYQRLAAAA